MLVLLFEKVGYSLNLNGGSGTMGIDLIILISIFTHVDVVYCSIGFDLCLTSGFLLSVLLVIKRHSLS